MCAGFNLLPSEPHRVWAAYPNYAAYTDLDPEHEIP